MRRRGSCGGFESRKEWIKNDGVVYGASLVDCVYFNSALLVIDDAVANICKLIAFLAYQRRKYAND